MVYVNRRQFPIEGPPPQFTIAQVIERIKQKYPQLIHVPLVIFNRNKPLLDTTKTITEYGIGYQTHNIEVFVVVPEYLFGSNGIISLMKINGSW